MENCVVFKNIETSFFKTSESYNFRDKKNNLWFSSCCKYFTWYIILVCSLIVGERVLSEGSDFRGLWRPKLVWSDVQSNWISNAIVPHSLFFSFFPLKLSETDSIGIFQTKNYSLTNRKKIFPHFDWRQKIYCVCGGREMFIHTNTFRSLTSRRNFGSTWSLG